MIDYNKLAKVCDSASTPQTPRKQKRVADSSKGLTPEQLKKIKDSIKARKGAKNSPKFSLIKVKDSYKNLRKKIQDELEETESTAAAVECALNNITPDTPAEDVLAAVIETLGETIDELSETDVDDIPEDELEAAADSCQKRLLAIKARIKDGKKIKDSLEDLADNQEVVSTLNDAFEKINSQVPSPTSEEGEYKDTTPDYDLSETVEVADHNFTIHSHHKQGEPFYCTIECDGEVIYEGEETDVDATPVDAVDILVGAE